MNSEIRLVFNRGYKWYHGPKVSFKGFFRNNDNHLLNDETALNLLEGISLLTAEAISENISAFDGLFSAVVRQEDNIIIITDRSGFFPLFFTYADSVWNVSDSFDHLALVGKSKNPDNEVLPEFLSAGYVLGHHTLDKNISKTCAGEIIVLEKDGSFKVHPYYLFLSKNTIKGSFEDISKKLYHKLDQVADRLVESLAGRTAVVPLSGGYDSRLIACLLKSKGYNNTICFTYGRVNKEAVISRKVADRLGFKWFMTDYTLMDYSNFLSGQEFRDYADFMGNGFSMPYLQEYFAVKMLKEEKLVPQDAVFLPGHPGDYLGGSYIDNITRTSANGSALAEVIAERYFNFIPVSADFRRNIISRVIKSLPAEGSAANRHAKYSSLMEAWDMREKRSKFIIHSASVFPFFDYRLMMPLLDNDLVDFMRGVPFEMRSQKKLYDSTLENFYFKPLDVYFGDREINPRPIDRLLFPVKKIIRKYLPPELVQRQLKKNDWVLYGDFTQMMQRQMESEGIKAIERYNSFNAIICRWYLAKQFGADVKDILNRRV